MTKQKYSCCGNPTASGGHQPHCPLLNTKQKEFEEMIKKWCIKGGKYWVDWKEVLFWIQTKDKQQLADIIKMIEESFWQCTLHEELQTDGSCKECTQCLEVNTILYPLIRRLNKKPPKP